MIVIHDDPKQETIETIIPMIDKHMEGMTADNPKHKNKLTSILCELYERGILRKPPKWTGDHTVEIYASGTIKDIEIDNNLPPELFDGFAVLNSLHKHVLYRTGANQVSDVLDAVVRLIKERLKNG